MSVNIIIVPYLKNKKEAYTLLRSYDLILFINTVY